MTLPEAVKFGGDPRARELAVPPEGTLEDGEEEYSVATSSSRSSAWWILGGIILVLLAFAAAFVAKEFAIFLSSLK